MRKTCSDKILAKLNSWGVAAAILSLSLLENFEQKKNSLCLEIVEIDRESISAHKNDSGKNPLF